MRIAEETSIIWCTFMELVSHGLNGIEKDTMG